MATKQEWLIDAVHFFSMTHNIGTEMTPDELGKWMVSNQLISQPASLDPKSGSWLKYVKERNDMRMRMNRFASSTEWIGPEHGGTAFALNYTVGNSVITMQSVHDDMVNLLTGMISKVPKLVMTKRQKLREKREILAIESPKSTELRMIDRTLANLSDLESDIIVSAKRAQRMYEQAEEDMETFRSYGITDVNNDQQQPLIESD